MVVASMITEFYIVGPGDQDLLISTTSTQITPSLIFINVLISSKTDHLSFRRFSMNFCTCEVPYVYCEILRHKIFEDQSLSQKMVKVGYLVIIDRNGTKHSSRS